MHIFMTGSTGYIGARLVPVLLERGHSVTALVRQGSERKLPDAVRSQIRIVTGDPLDRRTFGHAVAPADTFVQLVGVPHPSPAKAREFRETDLVSVQQSAIAARNAAVQHFVYVSVAQPSPVMQAYIEVRQEGERAIRETGLRATFVRPFYVLGPGHWWPYALVPFYWILERVASTRDGATRLGLVRLEQMIDALVWAVENPPDDVRVIDVPAIRAARIAARTVTT
jgi:nucleoside-diphosphate-sugar epimerase